MFHVIHLSITFYLTLKHSPADRLLLTFARLRSLKPWAGDPACLDAMLVEGHLQDRP